VTDISGDFELHITGDEYRVDAMREFATEHGLKFSHIVLDRGVNTSQPMLTVRGSGTLIEQIALGRQWSRRIGGHRLTVEAAPDNVGVPQTDDDAVEGRYFEHHVKLLLPDDDLRRRIELTALLEPLHARLSRNARRQRPDGAQERFVTQRCHREGRVNARAWLDVLLAKLRETGYPILEVEEEYVAYDSNIRWDSGWLEHQGLWNADREETWRTAPAGKPDYSSSYQPIEMDGVRQRGYFDPALKQFPHAYQAGNPIFADPAVGQAWRAARRTAILAVLGALTPFADQLVLRGSVPLRALFGDKAREPGDLDFVVTPPTMSIRSWQAKELLRGVIAAVGTDRASIEDIWTYERAAGKRLLFPFQPEGLPRGTVQVDLVFHEPLPLPAELILLDGLDVPVLAAPPALALAWKLQWLATDGYPQAKDLYDAMLLAEYTDADPDLVRELIRPELGRSTDVFGPETVLSWSMDWDNLHDQYPDLPTGSEHWQGRLALAMSRFWR
jgi:hypothetical protein